MTDGWIKIHRKFLDSYMFSDSDFVSVWIYLLLNSNHSEKSVLLNGRPVKVLQGQLITSRLKISMKTGVDQNKVERILKCFKSEQQIEQVSFTTCRLISIVNWEKYQINEQSIEQRMNSERTADEQRMNTNKKERINTNTHISNLEVFKGGVQGGGNGYDPGPGFEWFKQTYPLFFNEHLTCQAWLSVITSQEIEDKVRQSLSWQKTYWNNNKGFGVPQSVSYLRDRRFNDVKPSDPSQDKLNKIRTQFK
jgi:hypothetical protein